jgi:hypothetical protein
MSHKAHVFLKRPGQKTAKDIGVIDVDPAPGLHVQVTFTYMGKSEVGRINHIEPRDWGSQSSVTPKIVVIQSDSPKACPTRIRPRPRIVLRSR